MPAAIARPWLSKAVALPYFALGTTQERTITQRVAISAETGNKRVSTAVFAAIESIRRRGEVVGVRGACHRGPAHAVYCYGTGHVACGAAEVGVIHQSATAGVEPGDKAIVVEPAAAVEAPVEGARCRREVEESVSPVTYMLPVASDAMA